MPAQRETTNIIIKLSRFGHSNAEINDFIAFIETHNPSEEEAAEAVRQAMERDNKDK